MSSSQAALDAKGVYCGWVVAAKNKLKVQGQHTPLIAQSLFDDVQRALDGTTEEGTKAAPVEHKKVNSEFSLKSFVLCSTCGKKLTAGFAQDRHKVKYPRYWGWNPQCTTRVSAGRDEIEADSQCILGMLAPSAELIQRLPDIAKTYWTARLERITNERKAFGEKKAALETLNRKLLYWCRGKNKRGRLRDPEGGHRLKKEGSARARKHARCRVPHDGRALRGDAAQHR